MNKKCDIVMKLSLFVTRTDTHTHTHTHKAKPIHRRYMGCNHRAANTTNVPVWNNSLNQTVYSTDECRRALCNLQRYK